MTISHADIEALVDEITEEFRGFDLDPYGHHQLADEQPQYLLLHRHEYIRTIRDVVDWAERNGVKKILEIGAFFGHVSICLAKLGYEVHATDIPEYMDMPAQKERYGRYGITITAARLEDYILPFNDESFDVVIMCEILEHLNFNPLPLIKEINRIGRPDSLFYVSLPNLAQLHARLALLRGRSILTPIQTYFMQLDPNFLEIANSHWREYTAAEITEMLERMGYCIERQYYFTVIDSKKNLTLKNRMTKLLLRLFPSIRENQTTLAVRRERTRHIFNIPNTVHRELDQL